MQGRSLFRLNLFALLTFIQLACSSPEDVKCGPGTRLKDDTCVVASGGASGASGGGGVGGNAGSPGTGGACPNPSQYFRDADGDGHGGPEKQLSCSVPGPDWVTLGGDCNDEDPQVFPGSTTFYGSPYGTAPADSFDFDCDGVEEPDPGLLLFNATCGGTYPNCKTDQGYLATNRPPGGGRNVYCGSTKYKQCHGVFVSGGNAYCGSSESTKAAVGCR